MYLPLKKLKDDDPQLQPTVTANHIKQEYEVIVGLVMDGCLCSSNTPSVVIAINILGFD